MGFGLMLGKEQMNIVVVGHVDHGKSTLLGRLFADTGSLPDGKLEQIKEYCLRNSKVFEYAFLLDALKDEQSQGITIDSARAFFKSEKRDYILIDAPGHIEFLKNMISGAARAEAALLVIDANEGIQENSRRHAYMLSMLGIKQVAVCVNKMDLVDYDRELFDNIKEEFDDFLGRINLYPKEYIGISAHKGDNVAFSSKKMDWFDGKTILSILDSFTKEKALVDKPLRMPVQDVYKFSDGDDRRIIAGRVETGEVKVGDKVVFLPSNKRSTVKSIEEFNAPSRDSITAGLSSGITLEEQIFVNRGDIMCLDNGGLPFVGSRFKANIFWMGKGNPMSVGKEYKLKIGACSVSVKIKEICSVLDASNLGTSKKESVERHSVGECILETVKPIAFDLYSDIKFTGRFVLVDDYEIAGGGIITSKLEDSESKAFEQVFEREKKWEHGEVTLKERCLRYSQLPVVVLITGKSGVDKKKIAKDLERKLFDNGQIVYFLGIGNILRGLDSDLSKSEKEEHIRRFGEVAHILLDSGQIVLATASDLGEDDIKYLRTIIGQDSLVVVRVEENLKDADICLDADGGSSEILGLLRSRKIIFGIDDE